jgi:ABC-type transporter Mla subunit MlaD
MKPARGSKPASGRQRDQRSSSTPPAGSPQPTIKPPMIEQERTEPASSNPLADSVQRMFEQQMQVIEQQKLDTLKLTQQWLDTLHAELNALLDRMQTATARAGMKRAFNASAKQLGKVAVDAARKRG